MVRRDRRAWVLDTETTGLGPEDRIVSFGAIELFGAEATGRRIHLVFDPGRPSHPMARAAHGWRDEVLRGQDLFARHAHDIAAALADCDLVVAHNMSFDRRFIARELAWAGVEMPTTRQLCTMEEHRRRNPGRATLDHCLGLLGLTRATAIHGALEDAMLAATLWVHQTTGRIVDFTAGLDEPTNLRRHAA